MRIIEHIRDCSKVGHHAWYRTSADTMIRKPILSGLSKMVEEPAAFSDKWKTEREPSLYAEGVPKTQRQFFYSKYWEFLTKYVLTKFPPAVQPKLYSLDIGCGRATISEYLRKKIGMKELVMLDNDQNALELAKKNVGEGVYIHSDVTDLPFLEDTFDLTTSIGVVEHIDNYEKFFKEQHRVLKQWGVMSCLIIPEKFSAQSLNIFGSKKYKRNSADIKVYQDAIIKAGFPFYSGEWVAPYPIFTSVPMFLDKFITLIYRLIDWIKIFKNRKMGKNYYSFKSKPKWAQAYFVIALKL